MTGPRNQAHAFNHTMRTGDLVAIKTLASTGFHTIAEVEQVQEEMHVLAQLKHPNIIHLLDSMQSPDHSWLLVMEYASGGTLTNYLRKQVSPSAPQPHSSSWAMPPGRNAAL